MIWIDNKDMSSIAVDAYMKNVRKNAPDEVITPEIAVEFLKKTNHYANIKFLIKNINATIKTDEDVIKYKDFVLGAIEGREVSDETFLALEKMAVRGDFKEEFDTANKQEKYYKSDVSKSVVAKNPEEMVEYLKLGIPVFGDFREYDDEVLLVDVNLKNCIGFYFNEDADVCLNYSKGLRCDLNIPSFCSMDLEGADLKNVKNLRAGLFAIIDLQEVNNLPENIDISRACRVLFSKSNFGNVKKLQVGECENVCFSYTKNLPEIIDVSQCKEISFHCADVGNVNYAYVKDVRDADHFYSWSKNCKANILFKSGGGWMDYSPRIRVQERGY